MSADKKVVSIFRPSDNSANNLEEFIKVNQAIFASLFENRINWDGYIWDIKGFESTTSVGKSNQAKKILFTQLNGVQKTKIKVGADEQEPFIEPFLSFVKAHITHRHNAKRKTKDNHMVTIRAYRYLYEQLPVGHKDVVILSAGHFDKAAKSALMREKDSSAYRSGVALAEIAKLLRTYKLTPMSIRWKNPIPKPQEKANRNSKEAEVQRAKKLPKADVLIYLAALWNRFDAIDEKDKSLLCVAIILLFAGFRVDEVLGLDVDCLSMDDEFNPTTGVYHRVMKIRVLAKKSAQWITKKIPYSAQPTIQLAIDRLRSLSVKHRNAAKLLIREGKYHKLATLEDKAVVSAQELTNLLGVSKGNFVGIMTRRGVKPVIQAVNDTQKSDGIMYRVGDIHSAIHNEFVRDYPDAVKGFGNSSFRIPLYELITLRFLDEFNPKGAPQWYPLPISQNITQDFFRGRNYVSRVSKKESRLPSVFERYDTDHIDGAELSVHSHQFRHLLNTLMHESDVFEEHEIARYFMRNKIGDNSAYNHQLAPTNLVENSRQNIEKVLANLNVSADQAKETRRKWPTLSYDDVLKDIDEIGCAHTTDIGGCQHDYTQSPCEKHYQCLRNCRGYRRKKGDMNEINAVTKRRDDAVKQLDAAKKDMAEEFYGANNWVVHHHELIDGCNTALAIEDDRRYQEGEIVIVFPNGDEFCKV